MTERHYILATAGHVDHGKSALVKALTGTDPDRLPEEKARGITIDLGFASFELSTGMPQAAPLRVGVIDVPGHEDFIKNMVAGVGATDLALLVVAADDGWMPQTEEHVQILTYLGVTRAVVALTKVDLPGIDLPGAIQSLREHLAGTPFYRAPIIPTSVLSNQGLEELKESLGESLAATPAPRDIGKPRLSIDRCFILRGIGTIVTGTLQGGALSRGQSVILQPGSTPTRIRTVHNHTRDLDQAVPGMRTALNLTDVTIGETKASSTSGAVCRGQVVTVPELGGPAKTINVWLERSARPAASFRSGARVIKDGTQVRIHHGTANIIGRVLLVNPGELQRGESALAQIRLASPGFFFAGDRFVVRDCSEQITLAGGLILEICAQRKHFRRTLQPSQFQRQVDAPLDPVPALQRQLRRELLLDRSCCLVQSNFSSLEIHAGIEHLVKSGAAIELGPLLADRAFWGTVCKNASETIDRYHQAHPEEIGIPLGSLRSSFEGRSDAPEAFAALLGHLSRNGFVQVDGKLKRASHRPSLPPPLRIIGAQIREALGRRPLDPPSRKDLAPSKPAEQALRFFIQTGEVVEVGPDLILRAEDFAMATAAVKRYLTTRGPAAVSEIRQAVGASRRIVVPLLEKLDRAGVTQRKGDLRVLTEAARSS